MIEAIALQSWGGLGGWGEWADTETWSVEDGELPVHVGHESRRRAGCVQTDAQFVAEVPSLEGCASVVEHLQASTMSEHVRLTAIFHVAATVPALLVWRMSTRRAFACVADYFEVEVNTAVLLNETGVPGWFHQWECVWVFVWVWVGWNAVGCAQCTIWVEESLLVLLAADCEGYVE